jgi:thioredoxin-dependent peroxiredoxin
MPLQTGAIAPCFQAEDSSGNLICLDDYAGRTVLLSFFRNAACALCNLRVHQLIERYPAFQQGGLAVLAVFESPEANVGQYVGQQAAPFPILADEVGRLYALYGVETSESKLTSSLAMPETEERVQMAAEQGFRLTPEAGSNFNRMPADFLIGYASYVTDHLPFAVIEQYLAPSVA